jgi:BirA family biotin operon repressor/biotin-[acetyl-CoA-carboxylase] ligase
MRTPQNQNAIDTILEFGWVRRIEWYDEIDSTNSAARRALFNLAPVTLELPALFIADQQTAGRGRLQRSWWSPLGCLMLTLALPSSALPEQPNEWSQLALISGLAVANTVGKFVEPRTVQLKWPNDVYVSEKKIAGVLIESDAKVWLIGIGLNVQVDWSMAPTEVAARATCITSVSSRAALSAVVLVELIGELQQLLNKWRAGDTRWRSQWQQHCLLTGRVIRVRTSDNQEVTGYCEGLDSTGRLIVRDVQGVQFLATGEVLSWQ